MYNIIIRWTAVINHSNMDTGREDHCVCSGVSKGCIYNTVLNVILIYAAYMYNSAVKPLVATNSHK